MHMLRRSCIAIALVCAFFNSAQAAYVGKKFPSFNGKDARTGKNITLEDLKGQVVLVDFWATWCPPCVAEIPNIKKTYDQFKDKGFAIISVSLDSDISKCKSYIGDRGMDWMHIVDGGGWNTRLAKKFNIRSIPAMFLIDHEGTCIAEDARGAKLTQAVEKAIKRIPAKSVEPKKPESKPKESSPPVIKPAEKAPAPIAPPAPTVSEAEAKRMQAELSPVEREVAEVDSILGRYVKRIDAAKQSIPSIESDLPSPRNAAITRESYLRLRNDLIALRRELFALGLLNGRVVRVPSDPFTGQPQSDLRPFFQAKTQLPNAALALQEMSKAIAPEIESLNLIQTELGKLGSELAQLRGDPNDLAKRCDDLCARGRGDVAKWRSAWLGQLQNLPDAVVQLNAPTAQIEERCAEMDKQIASIRDRLKPKAGEAMDLTKAREEFAAMIATMNATAQDLRARGVAKAITMPTNPFEKRSSNDRVLVAEAEVQLKVGADTVRQIRSASAGLVEAAQQRAQAFIPRIQELQKGIATTTSDPKALLRVQSQYESLCAEILAANDQNSPS